VGKKGSCKSGKKQAFKQLGNGETAKKKKKGSGRGKKTPSGKSQFKAGGVLRGGEQVGEGWGIPRSQKGDKRKKKILEC